MITTIPLPFINPKWSEQCRYDLEETVVTSYDLNRLEKQHKTAFYCFGKNGTIFGKHLIVLARTGLAPEATLATLGPYNHWIWF